MYIYKYTRLFLSEKQFHTWCLPCSVHSTSSGFLHIKHCLTRMHSSRMRTVRCSCRLLRAVCVWQTPPPRGQNDRRLCRVIKIILTERKNIWIVYLTRKQKSSLQPYTYFSIFFMSSIIHFGSNNLLESTSLKLHNQV